jgi:hypothetical protein
MRLSQTPDELRALTEFQNHCEIRDITLLSCNVVRAKGGSGLLEPISIRPTLSNISSHFQSDLFIVEVSFEYAAWDSSEPAQRAFLVNSTFEVTYDMLDSYEPTDDEKLSFSKGTAVFNCWPYAREFFRDITARIGHQTPVLPLLRITPKKPESLPDRQDRLEPSTRTALPCAVEVPEKNSE